MGGKLFSSNREVFKLAQGVQDSTKQVIPQSLSYGALVHKEALDYSKNMQTEEGVENMEFQWVLKKEHVEIGGVNLKASWISRGA